MSAVDTVKDSGGELVLAFHSRIGAAPYFRHTGEEWEAISLMHVPTPDYGQSGRTVHLVRAHPDVEESWLRERVERTEKPPEPTEVIDYGDSPFADAEEIPHRDEITDDRDCPECGEEYREYIPEPLGACPDCRE